MDAGSTWDCSVHKILAYVAGIERRLLKLVVAILNRAHSLLLLCASHNVKTAIVDWSFTLYESRIYSIICGLIRLIFTSYLEHLL